MTTVGIIRHGLTQWNLEGRMQGHRDIPLNDEGRKQAEALGLKLSGDSWDLIVSSDLSRAVETARIIADRCRISLRLKDRRLRERDYGSLEGTTQEERIQKWGEHWRTLSLGMESDEELTQRALECLEDYAKRYAGKKILMVSHGGLISRLLRRLFPGLTIDGVPNTAFSLIYKKYKKDGQWEYSVLNSTDHLQ